MRFHFTAVLSALFAAGAALAQSADGPNAFKVPSQGFQFAAGKDVTLEWGNLKGTTVTLILRQGNQGALNTRYTIASSVPNSGSYTWSVPANTVQGTDYAIQIVDDQDTSIFNYTPPIYISSTVLQTSSVSSSGTSTASSASTASTDSSATASTTTGTMTTMTTSASSSASATTTESSASTTGSATASASTPTPTNNGASAGQKVSLGLMGLVAGVALAL